MIDVINQTWDGHILTQAPHAVHLSWSREILALRLSGDDQTAAVWLFESLRSACTAIARFWGLGGQPRTK
jgi:hypothetical protein